MRKCALSVDVFFFIEWGVLPFPDPPSQPRPALHGLQRTARCAGETGTLYANYPVISAVAFFSSYQNTIWGRLPAAAAYIADKLLKDNAFLVSGGALRKL